LRPTFVEYLIKENNLFRALYDFKASLLIEAVIVVNIRKELIVSKLIESVITKGIKSKFSNNSCNASKLNGIKV
jgi:hypothetical protein